jgi:hypothetical protein
VMIILMRVVGRSVFLEVILQAFIILSDVDAMTSSGVMSRPTFFITRVNVGCLAVLGFLFFC